MKSHITRRKFIKDAVKKGATLAVASQAVSSLPDRLASAEEMTLQSAQATTPDAAIGETPDTTVGLREAMFYKQLDGVMIQCMLEPRQCIVNNWERGYCGAKENRDGKYYTLVYSRPCTVYVEPIERESFYYVHPGSQFLGIGTAGCNLECKFCETWHISQVRPEETEMENLSPEDAVRLAASKGCRTIAFTYNEPVVCYENTVETAKLAKQAGLTTVCHTAGYIYEEPLKTLLAYMDAVNVDLKGFTDKYYLDKCGIELEQVLNTLNVIKRENVMLEITNLIVPGCNDAPEEITNMVAWIKENLGASVPLHFSRFFPNYQLKDLPATPIETMDMACDVARSGGLEFVHVGNVPGHKYESTYCPGCETELIHRSGSEVSVLKLDDTGTCEKCGRTIPGIWA